jgi:hypothetical protein
MAAEVDLITEAHNLAQILERCADGGYTLARIKAECAAAKTMLSRLTTALAVDRASLAEARASGARMAAQLEAAALQFEDYARQHRAKTPPDVAKAETNERMARACRDAMGGTDARAAALPDGWVAVPKEPTEAMIVAVAGDDFLSRYQKEALRGNAIRDWKAMLAASPRLEGEG